MGFGTLLVGDQTVWPLSKHDEAAVVFHMFWLGTPDGHVPFPVVTTVDVQNPWQARPNRHIETEFFRIIRW